MSTLQQFLLLRWLHACQACVTQLGLSSLVNQSDCFDQPCNTNFKQLFHHTGQTPNLHDSADGPQETPPDLGRTLTRQKHETQKKHDEGAVARRHVMDSLLAAADCVTNHLQLKCDLKRSKQTGSGRTNYAPSNMHQRSNCCCSRKNVCQQPTYANQWCTTQQLCNSSECCSAGRHVKGSTCG